MFRLIVFLIFFYIIWKTLKFVIKFISLSQKKSGNFKRNTPVESKFENVEDAVFTEIKTEKKDSND